MRVVCRLASALVAIAACDGSSHARDESRSPSAPADSTPTPRLVATATVHGAEPLKAPPATPPTPRPGGPEYERALAMELLPDVRGGPSVRPSPSDETDLSNYQAGGNRLFVDADDVGRVPAKFFLNFDRLTSGVAVITLDTTLTGHRLTLPFDFQLADSIAIAGLGRRERVAVTCRLGAFERDERILGLMRTDTREQWMPPRLAWFVDTTRARIRAMRPTSVRCIRDEDPD